MGVKYKFDAIIIASDQDHKITKIRHFVVYHKHSNVATFEGSYERRTFDYALL